MATVRTVSFSEIDCARQCFFKHALAYRERWTEPTVSPALSRGTLMHSVLEAHYVLIRSVQQGILCDPVPNADEIMRIVINDWLVNAAGGQSEEQELVEWLYRGYVEYHGLDSGWKIMAIEHPAEVWLPTERGGRSNFKLKMKIDLIVRETLTGNIYLVDHKTGKDLPKDKELDIDDQFGLYTWAMRQLKKPVFGSLHNAIRTFRAKDPIKNPQPLEERFKRTRLSRTDTELNNIAIDAYRTIRTAYGFKSDEAPRSPNSDTCRWKCSYTDPCLFGRKGQDHRLFLRDAGFIQDRTRH